MINFKSIINFKLIPILVSVVFKTISCIYLHPTHSPCCHQVSLQTLHSTCIPPQSPCHQVYLQTLHSSCQKFIIISGIGYFYNFFDKILDTNNWIKGLFGSGLGEHSLISENTMMKRWNFWPQYGHSNQAAIMLFLASITSLFPFYSFQGCSPWDGDPQIHGGC